MPNWCDNHVTISGLPDRVAAFVQRVQGTPEAWGDKPLPPQVFCFNTLVPIPAAVVAQGFGRAGFDWRNAHWGTKWEAGCATNTPPPIKTLCSGFATVYYLFDTAWSPSLAWLDTVAAQWLDLRFRLIFGEPAISDFGKIVWNRGARSRETTIDARTNRNWMAKHFVWVLAEDEDEEDSTDNG